MAVSTTRLSDLCDFVGVQVNPATRPDDVYVGLEHVAPGRFVRVGEGRAGDVQSSKYAFRAGDVLYGRLRPYLDKAVLADDSGICTTELLVLRPKEGVDPRFVAGVVHAPRFVEHAIAGTTGVQHPRTSWNHIRDYELPAFGSDEQAKIANLLWEVHDATTANEAVVKAATDLKRSAMRVLFTRGLGGEAQRDTEFGPVPQSWNSEVLDACAFVQTGATKGRRFADSATIEVPYLRVANVQDGHLDLREVKTIRIRVSEVDRYRLKAGDVVLTEGGDFDKLGRGFIWRGEIDLCVHQNHVFAVRPYPDRLKSEFLAYLAQSAYGKAYFLKVAHKTTNLASINSTKLKAFPLVLPLLDEQDEIVGILQAIDRKIDLHNRKRAVLDELFKTLLHKLMTGEIQISQLRSSALSREKATP